MRAICSLEADCKDGRAARTGGQARSSGSAETQKIAAAARPHAWDLPLIMCGGAGTRLWPASRESRPKQFLPLFGALSTFQDTVRRVADPALFARPIVVTNGQYRFLVAEQLAAIGVEADILLEPARRDSGPAIAAGAGYALQRDDGAVIVGYSGRSICSASARARAIVSPTSAAP
jgi:mannose-1-phosphate guanylyltransferase